MSSEEGSLTLWGHYHHIFQIALIALGAWQKCIFPWGLNNLRGEAHSMICCDNLIEELQYEFLHFAFFSIYR